MNAGLVLILLAFVFALLAAIRVPSPPRLDWGWLAVTLWFASLLVGSARLM
jgi:hypothetical protein